MEKDKFGKSYPVWSKIWEKPLNFRKRTGVQLYAIITDLIRSSDLQPEMRLPPIYLLANKLQISSRTVNKIYKRLEKERLLIIHVGKGAYVSPRLPSAFILWPQAVQADLPQVRIQLRSDSTCVADNFLLLGSISPDADRIAMGMYLDYFATVQRELLRKRYTTDSAVISQEIAAAVQGILKDQGIAYDSTCCRLLPSTDVLDCICAALVSSGEVVVMDSPNDFVPQACFQAVQAQVIYCGDGQGSFDLNLLGQICEQHRVRLVFVRPSASFPGLHVLHERARNYLVDLSVRYSFVIVSMHDSQGWFHRQPLAPLLLRRHTGNVIYICPFSNLLELTRGISVVIGSPTLMCELDRRAFWKNIQVRLDELLYATRLYHRGWISNDMGRLVVYYQQLQNKVVALHAKYLFRYSQLVSSRCGIRFYLRLDDPLAIDLSMLEKLAECGLLDTRQNMHVDWDRPVVGFAVGYANMTVADIESFFILLGDTMRKAKSAAQ